MPTATNLISEIPWQQVCTNWEGWGKAGHRSSSCRVAVPLERVATKFEPYWREFLARESEDDGTEPPTGIYAQLEAAGYPSLENVLASHPLLFSELVMQSLQTEFAGYVLCSPSDLRGTDPSYFLHSLSSVAVIGTSAVIEGSCSALKAPRA